MVLRSSMMLRAAAILVAGAFVLWISIGVTANFTIAREMPDGVRSIWPSGVNAKVAQGRDLLLGQSQPSAETMDRMRATLREAALREPVNTQVLGTLAGLDDLRGNADRARALFKLSEAASRRNRLTEMWLIEDAVSRNQIGEALTHYDHAMRVSIDLRPQLLPVMNSAASSPDILSALVPILRQRPLWWKDYLQFLGEDGSDPQVIETVLANVRPNIARSDERVLTENVLRRMIATNGELGAVRAANALEGIKGSNRSLRGGDFDAPEGILPFAWWMRDESNIRAYRDTVPNGTLGLRIETSSDTTGGAAQQLVGLPAGTYLLSGIVGDVPADPINRPEITIACGNAKPMARFTLPTAPESGAPFRFRFVVPPAGCPTQWVGIATAPVGDTHVWLDTIKITPERP
ncbi:hypothetical protein NYR55_07925 [Sphingomonas sp. BGYR3]|uniref:hypothetical protein n=1 Tax=Sphingomonas sp. BGYR3 TaxID=2975483 RepID=UPI0021A685B9|nr:hypothetical protein [Sphingomonas sp. BGYR3]MDG5488540.1 hypothetical protein [Sphingomonas sp. BGYR3]